MIFINNGTLIIPRGISPSFSRCGDYKLQHKTITFTNNGKSTITPDTGYDGILDIDVTVDVNPELQNKSLSISANGTYKITHDTNYYGIDTATIDVNVPDRKIVLQEKTCDPAITLQNITYDTGYDGLSKVILNPVTANIDDNIKAENIISGINILGVEGTYKYKSPDGQKFAYSEDFDCSLIDFEPRTENNCESMFANSNLAIAPYFDTSAVTSIMYMFENTSNLINIPEYDISNVSDFSYSFRKSNIHELPWKEINVAVNEYGESFVDGMFTGANKISEIPLIKYDVGALLYNSSFIELFKDCTMLTTFSDEQIFNFYIEEDDEYVAVPLTSMFENTKISKVPNFENYFYVNSTNSMFKNCTNLTDISGLGDMDFGNADDMSYMFYNCTSLNKPLYFNQIVSNRAMVDDMSYMCYGCTNLPKFMFNLGLDYTPNFNSMFSGCTNLTDVDLTSEGDMPMDLSEATNTNYMFKNCTNLTNILAGDGSYMFNTSSCSYMFAGCTNLTGYINLITNYCTDVYFAFNNCGMSAVYYTNLTACTSTRCMFYNCQNLEEVEGEDADDPTLITNANRMFYNCPNLKSFGSIYINTDSNKSFNINSMFYNCQNLTRVGIITLNENNLYDKYEKITPFAGYTVYDKLTDFGGVRNLNKCTIDFTILPNLSKQSMLNIINKVQTVPSGNGVIIFNNNLEDVLSEEEVKIATDKNWKIQYFPFIP